MILPIFKFKSSTRAHFSTLAYSVCIILLSAHLSSAVDTCSNSAATLYDGYLDTFISYGQFSQNSNSYFQFANPFQGQTPLNSASVQFWAKIPSYSIDGTLQTGRLLDCSETVSIKMLNDTLRYDVVSSSNQTSGTLSVGIFKNQLPQMRQWNHYGFFYSNKTITMTFNGVMKGQQAVSQSSLNSSTQMCTIGNSMYMNESMNVYLRHFLFSKMSWSASLNLTNLIHHITQPTDSNSLAYYKFQSSFNYEETYYHNASRVYTSNGLSIQQSSEPEFVCYCTGSYPNYLNVTAANTLSPINLVNISNTRLDNGGFTLDFQIYPQQAPQGNSNGDQTLFSIQNYSDIVLTNQSSAIRVDLYNSTGVNQSILLSNYRFRFNYWTWYTVNVTKTNVTLYIDGTLVQTASHKVNFSNFTNSSSLYFTIKQPQTITYLLNNVTLKNSKSVLILNNTYLESSITPSNYSSMISNGNIKYGSNNQFCYSTLANLTTYWTGSNCIDRRLSPQFNNRSQNSTIYVSGITNSSLQDQTISLWVRDFGNKSGGFQVIFENTIDGTNPLLQLSITNGNTTSQTRNVSCSPQAYILPSTSLLITNQNSYNQWNHFSCQSDSSIPQIKSIYYSSINANYTTTIISGQTFYNAPLGIQTSIGSSINGANKFSGFIREIKIWNNAKSEYDLNIYRFQGINPSTTINLLHYFRLGDQINANSLQDSYNINNVFLEQSQYTTAIDYNVDTDLIICQPGYYYNGQCCSLFNISNASFTFSYSTSQNYFLVSLDSTSVNSNLYTSLKANFTVVSVGNNYQTTYLSSTQTYLQYLNTMFTQNQTQKFNVSSFSVSPQAYNITLQATIYSDYYSNISTTVNQTITLTCPMIWLNILPNYVTDSNQTVSLISTDYQPVIYAQVQSQCYNPSTGLIYTASTGSIKWSTVGSNVTLNNTFTVSSDGYSISSVKNKSFLTGANQYLKIQANMTVGKSFLANTISLYYAPIQIINNNATLFQTYQILYTQPLTIDLTSAQSSLTSSNQGLTYQVQCPQTMFSNTSLYTQLCALSSSSPGLFTLDTSQVTAVSNYNYTFTFQIILTNTSILQNIQAVVQFYKDGSNLSSCPVLMIQSLYNYSLNSPSPLQLLPDPYLSCFGIFYSIQTANWTVTDSLSGTIYSQILVYGNQTVYRFANITSASIGTLIQAGALLNIQVTFNLNQNTSQSLQQNLITQATTQVQFAQQSLVGKVQIYDKNKTLIANNSVSYMEESMIANASSSYDPDNSSANLTYVWTCPQEVLQYYTCASLQRGSQNQYLYLNALQRAKIGFLFNTSYSFGVTVSSLSNAYKVPVSTNVSITFNPPTKLDSKNNYDMAPQCEHMSAQLNNQSLYYQNASYPKVLRFDILNYSNAAYNLSFTNTAPCKNGNVSEQIMLFYDYDNFFQPGQPSQIIYEQNSTALNSSLVLENMAQYNISAINVSQLFQSNIYWYTLRSNSPDAVYLNIETVYYILNRANLVVSFVNYTVTIDKYDNLILDASQSYDPEPVQSTYTFKWTCPGNISTCAAQNTSILNATSQARSLGLSNNNGTVYQYSVVMQDIPRNRVSAPGTANVTISMKSNYSYCISTAIQSDLLASYWSNTNQTVYFQSNQSQSINVQMNVTTSCPYLNLETAVYSTSNGAVLWTVDNTVNNSINLNSSMVMKNQKPETITPVTFKQRYSLGADTSIKYYAVNYVNVVIISPTIVPILKAPQISYFNRSNPNQTILFSYTNSNDTVSSWTYPSQLGGQVIQNSSLSLTYSGLNALLSNTTLSQYFNQPLQFTLTVNSTTDSRTTTKTQFLYLASNQSSLFTLGIEQCFIVNLNSTSNTSQVSFNTTTVFYFQCSNSKLAIQLLTNQSILWSIDSLQEDVDYYQIGQYLYLLPFQGSKLSTNEVYVGMQIYSLGMTSSVKAAFKITTPELQIGTVTNSPSDNGVAYSEAYNLQFSNFYAQYEIYFQLRGFYSMYQQYQTIFPIHPYLPLYLNTYYSSIIIPMVSELYVDFFDANSNYIGSYNLITNTFPGLTLGSYDQSDYENILNQISSQANYTNSSQSMAQLESDMYTIKCLSEALYYGIVNVDDDSLLQNYQIQILQYLITNFIPSIPLFSGLKPILPLIQIEKKVVYTLSNILTESNTQLSGYLNQTLSILQQVVNDYASIIADGYATEQFRQTLINIFETMDYQIANSNLTSTNYQQRLNSLQASIIGGDLLGLAQGSIKATLSGTTSRQILLLQTNANSSIQTASFTNQINSNESVYVSQEAMLSSYGVSSIEVAYSVSSNESSPAGTTLYINAYDSTYSLLSLDFSSLMANASSSIYTIEYALQATAISQALFQNTSDEYGYTPVCVYYDETADAWSTYGVTTGTYNSTTGVLSCYTQHLSTFSIDYTVQPYTPSGPTQPSSNQTSSSSTSSPLGPSNNGSTNGTVQYEYFFQYYTNAYGAIVGVLSVLVFADILLSFLNKTKWENGPLKLDKPEAIYGTDQVFKATMCLNHIFLSSLYRPKKGNIYMTMYSPNKVVFKWLYFFIIALIVEVVLMKSISIQWTINQQVGLAAIITAVIHGIRLVYVSLIYSIYFKGQNPEQSFDDISQGKHTYEGGSSEEEKDEDEEQEVDFKFNNPYHRENKQEVKASPMGKRDTISDVSIDSIEREIEQTNQNGFFGKGWHRQTNSMDQQKKEEIYGEPHILSENSNSHNDMIIVSDMGKRPGKGNNSKHDDFKSNEKFDTTEKNISEAGSGLRARNRNELATNSNMIELDSVRVDLTKQLGETKTSNELLTNKKKEPAQDIKIKSGSFIVAFLVNISVLFIMMGLAFNYMWYVTDTQHFHHWLGIILGTYFFIAFVLDPLLILLFSIIFSSSGQLSKAQRISGLLLVGNGHRNLVYGILYQLSN